MKKILLFVSMLLVLQSCKKSATTNSGKLFIQITVNGQTYKEDLADIGGTGFSGQTSCTNKPGFLQFGGMIETSQLEFEAYLFHNENETDFAAATTANARLVDTRDHFYSLYGACNSHLDLNISFLDKLLNDQSCSVETTGRTHTVESITLLETTSTEKRYAIAGSFSCTLRKSNNVTFPLTGKYRTTVSTLR
jgi:hypothetical protein